MGKWGEMYRLGDGLGRRLKSAVKYTAMVIIWGGGGVSRWTIQPL